MHNDLSVALGMIVLEAQQRHYSTVEKLRHMGERVGRGRGVEHITVPSTRLRLTGTESLPIALRIAECTMVNVRDAHGGKRLSQPRLRQSRLTTQRSQTHIHKHLHILCDELGNEIRSGLALIADADQCCSGGIVLVGGIRGSHSYISCTKHRNTASRDPQNATIYRVFLDHRPLTRARLLLDEVLLVGQVIVSPHRAAAPCAPVRPTAV